MHQLWVVTGPVFNANADRLTSGIAIPSAFYRIWLDRDEQQNPHAIAFLVPQDVHGDEPLTNYVVTVRTLEERTGLDFFSELPPDQQSRFENVVFPAYWKMESYAKAPARYAEKFRDREEPTSSRRRF